MHLKKFVSGPRGIAVTMVRHLLFLWTQVATWVILPFPVTFYYADSDQVFKTCFDQPSFSPNNFWTELLSESDFYLDDVSAFLAGLQPLSKSNISCFNFSVGNTRSGVWLKSTHSLRPSLTWNYKIFQGDFFTPKWENLNPLKFENFWQNFVNVYGK